MTAYVVALVSPEDDVEAWLTMDRQVTPAAWDAARFPSRAEATAHAAMARRPIDGRRWVITEIVEVPA